MPLGVDGSSYGSVAVSAPCTAWMVPLVPDDATQPCLHYATRRTHVTWKSQELVVDIGVLSSKAPGSDDGSIAIVKTIGQKHYAILKRGLLLLGGINVGTYA